MKSFRHLTISIPAGALFSAQTLSAATLADQSLPAGKLFMVAGMVLFALLSLFVLAVTSDFLVRAFRKPRPVRGPEASPELPVTPGAATLTRRSFLSLMGWAWIAFAAATLGALSTVLRYFFPNVTFEPPMVFKAGKPETFALGVDTRFKEKYAVWIVRDDEGFYCLSTVCTHLGCTPNWLSTEEKFKCPCHGSGFYISGINFEGPAPRPLPRYQVAWSDDGQIQVDKSVQFLFEKGEWSKPGSFLSYRG